MDDLIIGKFRQLLIGKKRHLVLTHHAEMRSSERKMENRLIQTDLHSGHIILIQELNSEIASEQVFDVRLIGTDGQPMRYILAINSLIRVITLMKVSRMRPGD